MPVIGQPAHTHFTPVVTPVVLDRISLSVTVLYNISAAAFRVSLSQTYVYDLKVIVSLVQRYLYGLNLPQPTGPTRLYFHALLNPLPNLPTTERSTLTPIKTVDAQTVNRTMNTIIGTAQASLVLTPNVTTTLQRYYFTKFVTDTLSGGISSITAQTWTYNFAGKGGSNNSSFPVSSVNQPVRVTAYVWRPSTQSKVGDIVDSNSASTIDKSTLEKVHHSTFSGIQVLGVQDGDVLVFEVWFEISQSAAVNFTDTFYYDGTTVNITKNTTVTNHASFLETPQGLSFGLALTRMSKVCTQKYQIIGRSSLSGSYNYNLIARVSPSSPFSQAYQYAIINSLSFSSNYLYDLTGRVSISSIISYDIMSRRTVQKIYRYSVQSIVRLSRLYKYNLLNTLTTSRVYKYNLGNAASLSQTYKYAIQSAVHLSRLYKYSIVAKAAQTSIYKYNIANRISNSRIFRYSLAVKLSLSRLYRYGLTNLRSASSHYRYSLLAKLSASRIFRYPVTSKVGLARNYIYNLTSFSHVVLSSVYKYNLARRIALGRIYSYPILSKLSLSRLYRYGLTVRATTSRVYKYVILNPVTLTRTYKYNLVIRLLSLRSYRYNLLGLRQKPQNYIYNLVQKISSLRTYRYRLGAAVSLSQTYLYNTKARVSLQSKYIYGIAVIPSGVLWQLTGKNTDFPDSLENLVCDYIKANWSVTDPVIGQTPIITSVISRQHQSQVDNFAYDSARTYYIRVKEVASEVKNRQVRLNTYEFETPIELECFSRRLKKGEAFNELNNLINELLRIFGTYQTGQIFGIEGITFDRITSMEKERPPATTTWARRLRIILHYYRVSVVG